MAIERNDYVSPSITRQDPELYGKTALPVPVQGTSSSPYAGNHDAEDINDHAIDTLSHLHEILRDGEYGFAECAEHTKTPGLKSVFIQRAQDCRAAGSELENLIVDLGGDPGEGGTMTGALHRGWVSVKGTLRGYSDISMLEECERGEDVALAQYRKALKQNLPAEAKAVVERQAQDTQANHDQIRNMRDAQKVSR